MAKKQPRRSVSPKALSSRAFRGRSPACAGGSRRAPMSEATQLEQRLSLLRDEIDWPATPALGARVLARIAAPAIVRRPWFQSRWALAAAAVLVVVAALVAYA